MAEFGQYVKSQIKPNIIQIDSNSTILYNIFKGFQAYIPKEDSWHI